MNTYIKPEIKIQNVVVEQLLAHLPQELVLGLEMGIKGTAADVRLVDDVLNGDVPIASPVQQGGKGTKNRRPGLLLSSVHGCLLYKIGVLFRI